MIDSTTGVAGRVTYKSDRLVFCKYCMEHRPIGMACCTVAKAEIADLKFELHEYRTQDNSQCDEYNNAVIKIAELKEAIEEAAYLLHLDLNQVDFPPDGEQNARRRIIEAYNGTKEKE